LQWGVGVVGVLVGYFSSLLKIAASMIATIAITHPYPLPWYPGMSDNLPRSDKSAQAGTEDKTSINVLKTIFFIIIMVFDCFFFTP
jgi:hypothetical protein